MYMITTSDIVVELILQQGYKNVHDFCVKNRLNPGNFGENLRNNAWTTKELNRLGRILRRNLMELSTVNNSMREND